MRRVRCGQTWDHVLDGALPANEGHSFVAPFDPESGEIGVPPGPEGKLLDPELLDEEFARADTRPHSDGERGNQATGPGREVNGGVGAFMFTPVGNWLKITVSGDSFDTFVIQ